jgi:anti-anti-sigma factor
VVTLPEHVDATNTDQFREQLLGLINRGAGVLIADMTMTVSCDHGGADALVRAYHRASVSGSQLRIAVASPLVRRILTVNGLDRLVSIYPSLESALAARSPESPIPARPEEDRPTGGGQLPAESVTPVVLWGLVDALADGILLTASDGSLVLVNRRAEEMFGYTRDELTGQPVETLLPASLRAGHVSDRAEYEREPAARPMGTRGRLVGLRKDGTTFPVEISLSPVPTATGRFTMATIRDPTHVAPRPDLADLARTLATSPKTSDAEFAGLVVNSLFHVGLSLQDAADLPHDEAMRRIDTALKQLDDLIKEIRDHVFRGHAHQSNGTSPNGS